MGKKFFAAAAGAAMVFTLAACSGSGAGDDGSTSAAPDATTSGAAMEKGTIGVAMPNQTIERWIADGDAVKAGLEEQGYTVDLQYAADDIPTQSQQIDGMITNGDQLLIIAAIDGTALSGQLEAAAEAGIPVISYDRLIRDSENVDFYVTFDNYQVGVQQATSLLVGLGILNEDGTETGETGPFNIELFAGSLDDNNAHFFYGGGLDTLQPYIDSGVLVVPSGQVDIAQVATRNWAQETAQKRMEDLITANYPDDSLDGVLAPNDGVARGILTALANAGYGPTIADGMPIVSGQDAEIASVKLIQDDVQFSSIFKDTRKLAAEAVTASVAFLSGETPVPNDTETYDNGTKIVPAYLLESDIVYQNNINELLVDSGYWSAAEIEAGLAE
ncbi:multiple monosaccharide ABC transporter substrate-binding protein [Demequina aurantiaca]|uniref:multiple monosaccharide ABC transporter substrate-binding protein n=1 Tax=Demequina aurantiaca TaxID=676200 RepID=UPI003D3531EE